MRDDVFILLNLNFQMEAVKNISVKHKYAGVGKRRFTVVGTQTTEFIFVSLFITYVCYNCKPTFAHSCTVLVSTTCQIVFKLNFIYTCG